MATILEFRPREASRDAHPSDMADAHDDAAGTAAETRAQRRRQPSCDILFFTGVRYSREESAGPFPSAGDAIDGATTGA